MSRHEYVAASIASGGRRPQTGKQIAVTVADRMGQTRLAGDSGNALPIPATIPIPAKTARSCHLVQGPGHPESAAADPVFLTPPGNHGFFPEPEGLQRGRRITGVRRSASETTGEFLPDFKQRIPGNRRPPSGQGSWPTDEWQPRSADHCPGRPPKRQHGKNRISPPDPGCPG